MSAWGNTQMLSSASKSMKQIEELGRLCYQNNIERENKTCTAEIINYKNNAL